MFCALATRKEDGSPPPPRFSPRSYVLATQPLISVGPPRLSCRKHRKDPRMRLVQEIERLRRTRFTKNRVRHRARLFTWDGAELVRPLAQLTPDSSPMTGRTHATAWCTLYVASTLAGRDGRTGLTNSPSSFSPRRPARSGGGGDAGGRSSRRR